MWGGVSSSAPWFSVVLICLWVFSIRRHRANERRNGTRIEIAVLPGCPWCARALRLLNGMGLAHSVTTVSDDASFEAIQTRSGMRTFPQVHIDGTLIGGYDELSALHSAGELAKLR